MNKDILDACCGKRMMWFNKTNENVLYVDERSEITPNKIEDFRNMTFADDSFKMVVFDPPHLIGGKFKESNMQNDYGDLNKKTWKEDLKQGFDECIRVLEEGGFLIFKWSDCNRWSNISNDCNVKTLLTLFGQEPLFGHKTRANKNMISSTYWFCFRKEFKIDIELEHSNIINQDGYLLDEDLNLCLLPNESGEGITTQIEEKDWKHFRIYNEETKEFALHENTGVKK